MTSVSRCSSCCSQPAKFVRNHGYKIGSAVVITGAVATAAYDPSHVFVSSAMAAIGLIAATAKYMRGPSPLQGRVIVSCPELPEEDMKGPSPLQGRVIVPCPELPEEDMKGPSPLQGRVIVSCPELPEEDMKGPSPLQGRVIAPCPELPEEDRIEPENLLLLYQLFYYLGMPEFPDDITLTPLQQAWEIWRWVNGPGLKIVSECEGRLELHLIGLTALPRAVCLFRKIPTLRLSGNWLTSLPPEIGNLTALQKIYLSNNNLAALPPEIYQLPKLRIYGFDNQRHHTQKIFNIEPLFLVRSRPPGSFRLKSGYLRAA